MKFQRHLDGFRDYLRAHHFAARTLETYGANTKRFLAFLEQRYPRIDTVEQVTKDTILDYQRHLAEHEDPRIGALTHATQNLILRSVRKFFHCNYSGGPVTGAKVVRYSTCLRALTIVHPG